MVFVGTLLAESLREGAILEGATLRVRRISRVDAGDPSAGQPSTWTFIEFEVLDATVDALAEGLEGALVDGPWYCDFRNDDEVFVVFANRVFRYARSDRGAREEAERYARLVGVPEAQIDWGE